MTEGGARPVPLADVADERLHALVHELANLVQAVSGNLELLAQRTSDEDLLRFILNAREASVQLTALTRDFQAEVPDTLCRRD